MPRPDPTVGQREGGVFVFHVCQGPFPFFLNYENKNSIKREELSVCVCVCVPAVYVGMKHINEITEKQRKKNLYKKKGNSPEQDWSNVYGSLFPALLADNGMMTDFMHQQSYKLFPRSLYTS